MSKAGRVADSLPEALGFGTWDTVPPDLRVCAQRLENGGRWCRVSQNYLGKEVFSCRDAARSRERLGSGGNGGIPLWAELKSLVGVASDPTSGKRIGFAAHTRANTQFSEQRILRALGLSEERASIELLHHEDSTCPVTETGAHDDGANPTHLRRAEGWFGRVNPFNVDLVLSDTIGEAIDIADVLQILDESLTHDGGVPDTVMSNLGERRTAFEIGREDLVAVVRQLSPKSVVAPVSEPCPIWLGEGGQYRRPEWLDFPPPRGPRIGILTGNSPESGMTLWGDILVVLRSHYRHLSDSLMPEVVIHSLPEMGLSMELGARERQVRSVVKAGVTGLLDAGCGIVAVACNTTIYYAPQMAELCSSRDAEFVSIAEACIPAVKRALEGRPGKPSVALVGIGAVVDMSGSLSGYKSFLEALGITVAPCPADRFAFAVKSTGTQMDVVTEFRRLVRETIPESETVVILALTEASMVYREHIAKASAKWPSTKVFIDPLRELARRLVLLYLERGYAGCPVCQLPRDFDIAGKLQASFVS